MHREPAMLRHLSVHLSIPHQAVGEKSTFSPDFILQVYCGSPPLLTGASWCTTACAEGFSSVVVACVPSMVGETGKIAKDKRRSPSPSNQPSLITSDVDLLRYPV